MAAEKFRNKATANTGTEYLPYKFTGKEMDEETGLYYYGARYLDPKYSLWISTDPALGEYVPQAPFNEETKEHNKNLPGMGGIFNSLNLNLYHYAGNNPVRYTDPTGKYSWNQFKNDITPAINLDFGADYARSAADSWSKGNYLQAAVYELDAACEMVYDGLLAYGGAKAVDATIKGSAMLIGTAASLSQNSTVVLGKYTSGACGGYTKMADQIGGKCFQVPQGIFKLLEKVGLGEKFNSAWLKGVMDSGARILLNSNPNIKPGDTSAYAMEIRTMQEAGYKFVATIEKGVKCWEAVKE